MQLGTAAGIALLGGLVGAAAEVFGLSRVPLPPGGAGLATVAAVALAQALACLPVGLVAWSLCRAVRPGEAPVRRRLAWVAALVASLGLPALLISLRWLHKTLLPTTGVLTPAGLALTGAAGVGALTLGVLLVLVGVHVLRGGERALAAAGWLGTAAALAVVVGFSWGGASGGPAATRNVLIVSIDSLRGDVFDEYLELHAREPLRTFVSESRRYRDAQTTFTHSLPSHASLLTGLYPPEHGALVLRSGVGSPIRPETASLAEQLSGAGFDTAAVVTNVWLGPPFGLEAGFATFINYGAALRLGHFDPELAMRLSSVGAALRWVGVNLVPSGADLHPNSRLFLRWLRAHDPAQPFFGFLHFIEMHPPNDPPAELRARFCGHGPLAEVGGTALKARVEAGEFTPRQMDAVRAQVRCLYMADLARMERFLEPVLVALREDGWLDRTLVVLLSDHGESLYEKADSYGKTHVYNASSHVPFVVHVPGEAGSERDDLVSLIDVPATVYGFTGVVPPPGIRGRDLLHDPPRGAEDWVFVLGRDVPNRAFARGVQFGDGNKWIRDGAGREQWYDVARDPTESYDRLRVGAPRAGDVRARFGEAVSGLEGGEDAAEGLPVDALDPNVVDRLRSLGYVE